MSGVFALDDQRLTINDCCRAHGRPVCGCIVFWLQIVTEPFALFHHSVVIR